MKEIFVKEETLPMTYHEALSKLKEEGEFADCADWGTTQIEVSMTMVVENPLKEPMISKLFIGGPRELEQYRQELLDGILDFEIEKGNWVYTYHDRMVNYPLERDVEYGIYSFDQIQFVIGELKRNPSSRRAVVLVRDPSIDAFSDDPACLQHIQYFIRDDKLHCKVLFRSNDACKATFMNAFGLIMLQQKIANVLGLEVGTYTHRANSFHCYEKDIPMLDGYYKTMHEKSFEDCTYDYVGEWDELMEEYKSDIADEVTELFNR